MGASAILTHRYIMAVQERGSMPRQMSGTRKYAFTQAVLFGPAYRLPGLDVLIPLSLVADGNGVPLSHSDAVQSGQMHSGKGSDNNDSGI